MRRQLQIVQGASKPPVPFARIEDAIAAMHAGKMVIVIDDAGRENEGDLTIAAEKITPDVINFMAPPGGRPGA
jgi:3,4-dihydroxy 2-butanone 4-phosphate synthase/GTP cyclohydrolase II